MGGAESGTHSISEFTMSIALTPIVNVHDGVHYPAVHHPAAFGGADLVAETPRKLAGSLESVDSPGLDRVTAAGLQIIYAMLVLGLGGASLAMAGWLFLNFLGSQAAQLESLGTMQLLHALTGA